MHKSPVLIATAAFVLAGCAAVPPEDPAQQARNAFATLEQRLLAEQPLVFSFDVEADGAMVARLRGRLRRDEAGVATLDADGLFAERAVEILLRSNGETMTGGEGTNLFVTETPPALDDALLLGMTRMGVLHNLAMLASGLPPDHAGGGVREWLEVTGFELVDDPDPETDVISFTVVVDGEPRAGAVLWIDRASGWPVRRRQTVRFPQGTMEVVERYAFHSLR